GTLGRYLLNVSTAAELCSQTLCGSHGRCLRKHPDSDVYLHLSPLTHSLKRQNGKLTVTGELGDAEGMLFKTDFQCQCYSGFQGEGCDHKDPLHQRGAAAPTRTSALQSMRSFHPEVLFLFGLLSITAGLQVASSSAQAPFLTVWNAPTENCLSRYGVDLDLGMFSIVQNQNQTFMGENITIFYADKLGLYPRYSAQGQAINGGVPQNSSLDEHLKLASENIRYYIPDRDFQGLSVVDWESWRPLWERNWESKQVYKEGSKALVRSRHPDWSPAQVEAAARVEFQQSGRKFMEETLKLAQKMRPKGLWGFYGFPSCYNYYNNKSINYTGKCLDVEVKRNDQLIWLWNASSALYPDIYLNLELRGLGRQVLLYAHHCILEAMRAADQVTPWQLPVFTYARIVYTYSLEFLSKASHRLNAHKPFFFIMI
ncbi:hypothetical protein GOODEAATRI_014709, partial [Goodea atripinnis]